MKNIFNNNLFNFYNLSGDRGKILLMHNLALSQLCTKYSSILNIPNTLMGHSIIRFYSTKKVKEEKEDEILIHTTDEDSSIKNMGKIDEVHGDIIDDKGEIKVLEDKLNRDDELNKSKSKSKGKGKGKGKGKVKEKVKSQSKKNINNYTNNQLKKEIEKVKRLKTQVLGGFYTYGTDVFENLGPLNELNQSKMKRIIKKLFKRLDGKMTYSLLTIIRYLNYDTGETSGYTVGESIKINKYVSLNEVSKRIEREIDIKMRKYSVIKDDADIIIIGKKWLSNSEFKVTRKEITKLLNGLLLEQKKRAKLEEKMNIEKN